MGTFKLALVVSVCVFAVVLSGCISQQQYDGLKNQNRIQQSTITELQGRLKSAELELTQLQNKLGALEAESTTGISAKDEEIALLEKNIAEKKVLIEKLRAQILTGGIKLPLELSMMLKEFADGNEMVTFDEARGAVKFESDFLFKSGSDKVQPQAADAVKLLSQILSSPEAKKFDVVIAGHTDNDPIRYSKALHPTNWHLSVHRAIAVLNLLETNKVLPKRMSVRGFGQYRPIADNGTKQGKATNRRVEIFIVPEGN